MKKNIFIISVLITAAHTGAMARNTQDSFPASPPDEKQWIRSEGEHDEANLSERSFDAFLSGAGYIVYPVENDISVLQAKIQRNPMILHKEFIPRRVRVVSELAGQTDSRNGSIGPFAVVSEIGSASFFMVNKKDLHFVTRKTDDRKESK